LESSAPSFVRTELAHVVASAVTADPLLPRPSPMVAFWQEPVHSTVASIQSPELPQFVDIAIIGSGITGCSVAKSLLEDVSLTNQKIAVLEARTLTSCATGRNGGHLISDAAYEFPDYVANLGLPEAIKIARFSLACIARVKEVIASLGEEVKQRSKIRDVASISLVKDNETLCHVKQALALFTEALPDLKSDYLLMEGEEALKVNTHILCELHQYDMG
jgi:hypothetical protein